MFQMEFTLFQRGYLLITFEIFSKWMCLQDFKDLFFLMELYFRLARYGSFCNEFS